MVLQCLHATDVAALRPPPQPYLPQHFKVGAPMLPVLAMLGKCEPWCLLILVLAASSAAGLAVATFRSVLLAFCLFFLSFLCHASSFKHGVVSRKLGPCGPRDER